MDCFKLRHPLYYKTTVNANNYFGFVITAQDRIFQKRSHCHILFPVKQRVEQKLEQMGRPQGVRLHTAHVLCMEAILNVGLEMGSHNQDCWPHVFR